MFNKVVKTTVAVSLLATLSFGANGARFNVVQGNAGEKYEHALESLKAKTGFSVSDPHEKINDAYAKRYGNTEHADYDKEWKKNLDNLGFFTISNDAKLNAILKVAPEVAGFSPFNQLIYKKAAEDKTYIGHLDPETMLNIVGTKDANVRKDFVAMFAGLDKWTQDEFGGSVETTSFDALPSNTMMNFEVPVDRAGELVDFIDGFQEEFEAAFEGKDYIIAGYKNFKETYEDNEMEFDEYDAFFVYSLCHFTFSYNVFNKGRPDAGVFAPCSMYAYIKKDSNTMVIGMPRLSNWVAVMNIKDAAKVEWTKKVDSEIVSIMKSIGAKEI